MLICSHPYWDVTVRMAWYQVTSDHAISWRLHCIQFIHKNCCIFRHFGCFLYQYKWAIAQPGTQLFLTVTLRSYKWFELNWTELNWRLCSNSCMLLLVSSTVSGAERSVTVTADLLTVKLMFQCKCKNIFTILDFKLSPCSECCMLSSGWFTGICSLNANVSEHCICSIFIGK
jgi:hypothetical protein